MENRLPQNWVETEFANIIISAIGGDWGSDPNEIIENSSLVFCIRGSEIKDWTKNKGKTAALRRVKNSSLEKRKLIKGDILVEISGGGPEQPVGRTLYIDNDALKNDSSLSLVCTNFFRRIRVYNLLYSKYINYFLCYFYITGEATPLQGGSNNLRNLKFKEYQLIQIPLPPLAEQKRITDKLDVLFGQLDTIREATDRIPELIKNFRQQILTYAITGKLTKEWREGKNINDWELIPIRNLSSKVGSGSTPRGGQEVYKSEGIPFIRSMNIRFGGINYSGLAHIDDEQAYALRGAEVYADDVLLNITGASIGRVCLAPKELNGARVNQHVCIIRCNDNIKPLYLSTYLSSPKMQSFIMSENYGVTRQALTKEQILNTEIDLPHIKEQEEIVSRVQYLFEKIDIIEQRYQTLKAKLENLPQALLHKAFKGELVEQIPSDGNAADLLIEIEQLKKSLKKK